MAAPVLKRTLAVLLAEIQAEISITALEERIAASEVWFTENPSTTGERYQKALDGYNALLARWGELSLAVEISEAAAADWQVAARLKQEMREKEVRG